MLVDQPLRTADLEFALALNDICSSALALKPPKRISVADGVASTLKIARPGGTSGYWSADETPYMVEPMNMLASRFFDAVVFVGPAQSGKTVGLGEGWMTHAVVNDPGDMLMIQMSQGKAREYSMQRIDRAIENSPKVQALMGGAQDDNTHDKKFKHGMWLRIGWPTVSNLSSTSYRYVFLTDYDRMDDDIGGEGDAFGLASARTRTFLSRGMVCVESSPGREIVDPHWRGETAHEAPPVSGVLGIYNRSDRRRWHWKCPHCADWFEAAPGLVLFDLPPVEQLVDSIRLLDIEELVDRFNRVICPVNGCIIEPECKAKMNRDGVWLQDGLRVDDQNTLHGTPRSSRIAGYWLGGVAVAYQTWAGLLRKYFQALLDYAITGSEESLKTTVNTDQGMPYMSMLLKQASQQLISPEGRKDRNLERYIVPNWTRYLVAAVDIQGGVNARFVVQVHAMGPHFEQALVNRFSITQSRRPNMTGIGEDYQPLDPASYAEDWDRITEEVVRSTYKTPIADKELRVRMTVVDSGGEDGVTDKAYAWYRRVRRENLGLRVMLIKGEATKTGQPIRESMLGGRTPKEHGDVPVYLLNSNMLKDAVSTGLKRQTPGPGYYHFPDWLPGSFFDELSAEVRQADGSWSQVRKRNEAFDLCAYIRAGAMKLGADKIRDWSLAPPWARPLESNSESMTAGERREMKDNVLIAPKPEVVDLLNPKPAQGRVNGRRVARSSYLG